jgi:hypothetical protein
MRPVLILAALAMLAAAPTVQAQTLDKNGRCHDAAGKFAKADVCKGAKGITAAAAKGDAKADAKAAPAKVAAADPNGPYKKDAKGKCHDVKGKLAKAEKCAA